MTNHIKDFFNKMAPTWDTHSTPQLEVLNKIVDYAQVKEGDKVIDVACGTGVMINPILSKNVSNIYAIDISPEMIKIAKEKHPSNKIKFEAGDFTQTQLSNYDNIIIHNAYPHFLEKEPLIDTIYRSLKPGGRFTIAHSFSKKRINDCHHKLDVPISVKLEPAEIEAEKFKSKFNIDTIIDTPDTYIVSGVKK